MNSKINGVGGAPPRVDGTRAGGVQREEGVENVSGTQQADKISLTGSAQLMVRLEKVLASVPTVDRERVETIKQAIADGSYAVDAERVAAEVLRMEMGLKLL